MAMTGFGMEARFFGLDFDKKIRESELHKPSMRETYQGFVAARGVRRPKVSFLQHLGRPHRKGLFVSQGKDGEQFACKVSGSWPRGQDGIARLRVLKLHPLLQRVDSFEVYARQLLSCERIHTPRNEMIRERCGYRE